MSPPRPAAPLGRAFAALCLALAAACAWAESPPAGTHFLWEVKSLTNRAYLFGTIHAGKAEWFPMAAAIEGALADSKVLVVEADITDAEALRKSAESMVYAAPDSLAKHVKPADYARFGKLAARYALPEPQLAQMKPFFAASLLVFAEWGRLGYLPQYGLDAYLLGKARAEAKRVEELEGVEAQLRIMDSLTEEENRVAFEGVLTALESGLTSEQITGMVNAWQIGDPDLLLEIARKYNESTPGAKEFEEKFVWSRHDAMLAKIEGYLNASRDRHFVAVGSLHLAGPRGLVAMLRKRGYVVKQL